MKRPLRLVLLTALACFVVCGCGASSALAAATGGISGKVTDATTHKPIENLEVCAFSLTAEGLEEEASGTSGCAQTGAGGEYTISGLNASSYGVVFAVSSLSSSTNYIGQAYNGVTPPNEPTPVIVNAGATTGAIDAQLQEGSEVSGRITNASTGAPVESAFACALRAAAEGGLEFIACARSNANGEYTIRAIPNGSFYIGFAAPELATQYYPGKSSFTEAATVTISAPKEVKTGIDATMQPKPPESSNGEGPGSGGPPGSGFGPQPPGSPRGGTLVASKLAVSLASQRISVAHGMVANLGLVCVAATSCHGKLILTLKRAVRHDGKTLLEKVTLGAVRYSLRHGQRAAVRVRLDAKARGLLRSARGALAAQLTISQRLPRPGGVELENVVLIARMLATGR